MKKSLPTKGSFALFIVFKWHLKKFADVITVLLEHLDSKYTQHDKSCIPETQG